MLHPNHLLLVPSVYVVHSVLGLPPIEASQLHNLAFLVVMAGLLLSLAKTIGLTRTTARWCMIALLLSAGALRYTTVLE